MLRPVSDAQLQKLLLRRSNATSSQHSGCSCSSSLIARSELPVLTHRGAYPLWDEYLSAVYAGSAVVYPVNLRGFGWFYRCGACTAYLQERCQPMSEKLSCGRLRIRGRERCGRLPQAPIEGLIPLSRERGKRKLCQATRTLLQAFHSTNATHWGAPMATADVWLMEFGFWMHPAAGTSNSPGAPWLPNRTLVEVIRMAQAIVEHGTNATWYYHAPGSGVWLDLGSSTCAAAELPSRGAVRYAPCTDRNNRCLDGHVVREARLRGCETLQRRMVSSPALEIVDLRAGVAPSSSACPGRRTPAEKALRAGWNASARCTGCSRSLPILSCVRCEPSGPLGQLQCALSRSSISKL